jgi:hypothetical protein
MAIKRQQLEAAAQLLESNAEWPHRVAAMQQLNQLAASGTSPAQVAYFAVRLQRALERQVRDARPAVACQACGLVAQLAQSLHRRFNGCAQQLLPVLLQAAGSHARLVARAAAGAVLAVVRWAAWDKTALLCWAANGVLTACWPSHRDIPVAVVERQSLWLLLLLLETAVVADGLRVVGAAQPVAKALQFATTQVL